MNGDYKEARQGSRVVLRFQPSVALIEPGNLVDAVVIDRNARTPYTQQFNTSLQYELARNTTLQLGYAGSRGLKLFREVGINQARIASLRHPITNAVTGEAITDNTSENVSLRSPFQGVSTAGFALNESTAQSTYHSLQVTVQRQSSHGLQFSSAYTFSRSIDNASNPGGERIVTALWIAVAGWTPAASGAINSQPAEIAAFPTSTAPTILC